MEAINNVVTVAARPWKSLTFERAVISFEEVLAVALRPLFVSTYPPAECGLATFTKDSADAVDLAARERVSSVIAINKTVGCRYEDRRVTHVIDNAGVNAYRLAAEFANESSFDLVSLQHEFGLYPGDWGSGVLDFVRLAESPLSQRSTR